MDECFKSNKMFNRATSGCEATFHISEQIVGFKVPDMSTVDHLFHGFTYVTFRCIRTRIGRVCWILTRLWNRNDKN